MNFKIIIRKVLSWQSVKWRLVESRVDRLQLRIYRASKEGRKGVVMHLQQILVRSLDAKLLAVKRVTTDSSGRKTAGVDRKLYLTPLQKAALVSCLSVDGKAAPIRRVWIPKPGKSELRPLGIPIVRDRAKQKLVLMALEPAWEAKFEPNSFGFRPGRSAQDAMESIFRYLRSKPSSSQQDKGLNEVYVLDADLKGCFDNISHSYLLRKLGASPSITRQVRAWLRAGIFEGLNLTPDLYDNVSENMIGTPQGGVISPFLANVALHGMEEYLKQWILRQSWAVPHEKRHQLYSINKQKGFGIIRYADDFVVIHRNKEVVDMAKVALSEWLANTSGLKFNDDKTKIARASCGFNFLGFSFIVLNINGAGRIKIYPSVKNQKSLIDKVGERCTKYRSISTFDLIKSLRPVILGWANYFRFVECKETFSKLDYKIFNILRSWVFRRDKRHGRHKVKEKYFPSGKVYNFDGRTYKNNWVLWGKAYGKKRELIENFLPKLAWVSSLKHVSVRGTSSVYDGDSLYWAFRSRKYGNVSTRVRTLLKRQNGICPFCGGKMSGSEYQVDHVIPRSKGGKDSYDNLQLLHTHCHVKKTSLDRLGTS
jgi:group II intron reverse transcriptase/maturase